MASTEPYPVPHRLAACLEFGIEPNIKLIISGQQALIHIRTPLHEQGLRSPRYGRGLRTDGHPRFVGFIFPSGQNRGQALPFKMLSKNHTGILINCLIGHIVGRNAILHGLKTWGYGPT